MTAYSERKTIYIIRHGETEFNRMQIVQGSGVDTELNETGKSQAELFYEQYKAVTFDRLYISSLKRTRQSVNSFIELGIPVKELPELNEISWGDFEGKSQSPEERAAYWELIKRWNNGDRHAKIENGESPHEIQIRQTAAVHHILQEPADKNILICMHGRAMKSFLCLLLNKPISAMEEFQHSNLCLYKLSYEGNAFTLLLANNTDHLKTTI